ncbi:MAG: hypothetical protein SO188_14920 [Prevotella sp.]|nr:hypothetical protein [Prevotella sp.]
MNIEVTNINYKNVIECNSLQDNIRVRRSGTAKVVWRELNKDVKPSMIILGGVSTLSK